MESAIVVLALAGLIVVSIALVVYVLRDLRQRRAVGAAGDRAAAVIREAEEDARKRVERARDEARETRREAEREAREAREAERELKEFRREIQRQESRLENREESLDKRQESVERRETSLAERERSVEVVLKETEQLKDEHVQRLEAVANLSMNDAREQIIQRAEGEMEHDLSKRYYDLEQRMLADADEKGRMAVALSIQRLASQVVSETTTAQVPLPNDDMKGRLIGREGRNIRAIEAATGADLIIDDTPEAVTISCFDPIRREVARIALTNLIADGRIHPARVEEAVERAQEEVEETIRRSGDQAVLDAGVRGLHPELVRLIGRLKYRYSYGENVLLHSVEVAQIAGMLAGEIGADSQVAKAGGLLHDIGKALTHEVEGSHIEIGDEVARRYSLPEPVKVAIAEHHDDARATPEAFIVAAADAISAARPGARRDTVEFYLKRLEALEDVANSFPGVQKSYAIQAGREVRILVSPDEVDDIAAATLARNVVKKIEENLVYPGEIRVTVVRETRAIETAK
jgi:ribonuclease Y